ncbi:pantoate--beta-alanine ligase [Candidatus Pantoea carbekii]|uniref:Pantothenate synthetase n=1 Tax=Candidatus Pantoea carbekii TaxID=1235990 RepID=U3U7X7_9GAMM|nr:pantoate--beta-alanine ligase [Candidatus Pantoea carbekii]
MIIIKQLSTLNFKMRQLRDQDKNIALIPTMGNLHAGHLSLVHEAQKKADIIVVSIFVNPIQFENAEDLSNYPHTLKEDCKKLDDQKVDIVFIPSVIDMYPNGIINQTFVEVPYLSQLLEGHKRPGHFRGVTTIVSKLFNLVRPNIAFFGEKDFQQLVIIRKMVIDMNFNIHIVAVRTVRAHDGLALSSRNRYLRLDERKIAPSLYNVIKNMSQRLNKNDYHIDEIITNAEVTLKKEGLRPDSVAIVDATTLESVNKHTKHAVILIAAFLGKVRLIDSQQVYLNKKK